MQETAAAAIYFAKPFAEGGWANARYICSDVVFRAGACFSRGRILEAAFPLFPNDLPTM